ncbi:PHP domain-containing protein [Caballeronia fortuita]|uniref:PHP domain-containing protein n=1 Tax=Caballeronia fortuita TaxID=1777138 RepID=UPI0035B54141
MPALPDYAELFAFSNFSFLHGASHGEELVLRASQLGYAGLAITDECSVAGVVRAHVQAKEEKLPLIIGSYFRLVHARHGADNGPKNRPAAGPASGPTLGPTSGPAFGLILLAQNREGYGNLCELITLARMRATKGSYLLTPDDLARPEPKHAHLKGVQN